MDRYFTVGKIVNTHGIRGEVRVITISDFAEERYAPGNQLYYFTPDHKLVRPLTIKSHRRHKQFDLVSFEDHPTINDVEPYKGGFLKVKESDLHPLEEGEYYYHQIIGCKVYSDTGQLLGTVTEILSPGANDVWVVKSLDNRKEILVPYIDDVVLEVNPEEKKITIHLLEGLLE